VGAHDELGLDEVIHLIHPENARSMRVAEKIGGAPGERFTLPFAGGADVIVWHTRLPLSR